MPILCAASQEGLHRIVERILDRGADPNAKERVRFHMLRKPLKPMYNVTMVSKNL